MARIELNIPGERVKVTPIILAGIQDYDPTTGTGIVVPLLVDSDGIIQATH